MTLSMYQASVPVFIQGLTGLGGVIDKAAAHAAERKIDPAALLQARLYPDMFPFARQVQIATDFAKGGAARLAGVEFPAYEDSETSFEELKARVDKTIAFLRTLDAAQIDGSEERDISLVRRGETSIVKGQAYLLEQAMPNFYFHITTAYAIQRHNGVEVGKRVFLGAA
ncbi:DUF1993 family protein [Phenylobacterium sp.]|uniref:DUF1993 domain-containing protein n=1 Tax=Phenylobacterium sp. TaxID=1871053 RepID=UPI002730F368|nr:DUF1993 family protein [Phenylobacterium sp.]MDP1597616.1 DUF1993 family protein [Phenylobacterium sp.]MDP3590666.1 DUF1993 family protein [Phenylobacterium sp.]